MQGLSFFWNIYHRQSLEQQAYLNWLKQKIKIHSGKKLVFVVQNKFAILIKQNIVLFKDNVILQKGL